MDTLRAQQAKIVESLEYGILFGESREVMQKYNDAISEKKKEELYNRLMELDTKMNEMRK